MGLMQHLDQEQWAWEQWPIELHTRAQPAPVSWGPEGASRGLPKPGIAVGELPWIPAELPHPSEPSLGLGLGLPSAVCSAKGSAKGCSCPDTANRAILAVGAEPHMLGSQNKKEYTEHFTRWTMDTGPITARKAAGWRYLKTENIYILFSKQSLREI